MKKKSFICPVCGSPLGRLSGVAGRPWYRPRSSMEWQCPSCKSVLVSTGSNSRWVLVPILGMVGIIAYSFLYGLPYPTATFLGWFAVTAAIGLVVDRRAVLAAKESQPGGPRPGLQRQAQRRD